MVVGERGHPPIQHIASGYGHGIFYQPMNAIVAEEQFC